MGEMGSWYLSLVWRVSHINLPAKLPTSLPNYLPNDRHVKLVWLKDNRDRVTLHVNLVNW